MRPETYDKISRDDAENAPILFMYKDADNIVYQACHEGGEYIVFDALLGTDYDPLEEREIVSDLRARAQNSDFPCE